MTIFSRLFSRPKAAPHLQQKSSTVAPVIAHHTVGQPVWTPRQYAHLSEEGFQKNVIVYRCVNLIAKSVASVPWLLYQGDTELSDHPFLTLMNRPNPQQSRALFIETVVSYLLLSGNTYVEGVFTHDHTLPTELYTLRPDRMTVTPGASGLPQAYEYRVNGHTQPFICDPVTGASPILHLKNFHPLNDWYGLSPLEAAAGAIDQHNVVSGHNLALLQNGGRPSGALMVKPSPHSQGLTDTQREMLREDMRQLYQGGQNAGRLMILEGDFEWTEMGLSPKDLDFINGKNLTAREIAQAFGVPAMLVGVQGDSTFANYKEARFHLWEDTVLPLLDTILAEMTLWLGGHDMGMRFAYDIDAIPALAPRREAMWAKINNADFLTINEKRQAVGYTPLENGDHLQPHSILEKETQS